MLEKLLEILGNSHFEAWVVGGVTGAIYGQIFGAFGKRGGDAKTQQSDESPLEIQRQIRERSGQPVMREVLHYHYHHNGRSSNNGDDAFPLFFVTTGLVLLVALLMFAAYLPQIADTLYFSITTIAVFSVASGVSAAVGGRFNTAEWCRIRWPHPCWWLPSWRLRCLGWWF